MKELVSQQYGVFNLFLDFVAEGPRLSIHSQTVRMGSKERHHATHLVPSDNNLFVTWISVEAWNVASDKRQTYNRG